MNCRWKTSMLRISGLGLLAPSLLFHLPVLAEPFQASLIESKLARFEKDTAISCDHQRVSEAREMNADFTIKRIETQWNQVKAEIKNKQNYLNNVDSILARKIHEELIEAKDILEHERLRVEATQGRIKTAHEENLKAAGKKVQRLQELSESFKKSKEGVVDPIAQQYIDSEVASVQEQIRQYSRLSDRHQALIQAVQVCWASAGTPGTPGRTPYVEAGSDTPITSPAPSPATVTNITPVQPASTSAQ